MWALGSEKKREPYLCPSNKHRGGLHQSGGEAISLANATMQVRQNPPSSAGFSSARLRSLLFMAAWLRLKDSCETSLTAMEQVGLGFFVEGVFC